jgi:superoxide oxidase
MKRSRPASGQFTTMAKTLHWTVAFLMLSVVPVAFSFAWTPVADRAGAIPVHASIGLIVVVLTLIRLGWRAVSPPPPLPSSTSAATRTGARYGHAVLYGGILFQGVLGIWMAALSPSGIRVFNTFDLAALAPASPGSLVYLRQVHFVGACVVAAAIVAHVAAALWHHFRLRDDVLIRMLPLSGLWQRLAARS